MNKYFNNTNTLEELRKQYKELLKQHHPDNGGNVSDMQEINSEYDRLFKILKNQHESNKANSNNTNADYNNMKYDFAEDEKLREMLNKIIHFKGIDISILKLFITDFLFIVLLQQILLIGYILIYIVKKLKYLIFVISMILILLIPKNIVALEKYYLILISLVGLFIFINKNVNKKYHKRIIQEIGGV